MSIRKDQVLELFSSNPEKEFSFNELVEFFKVRTKPRKKLMPFIQSLTNTGFLYRLGKDRYISSQSSAAKAAKEAKGEKIENIEDKKIRESKDNKNNRQMGENTSKEQMLKQNQKQGHKKEKKQDYRRGARAGKSTNEQVIGRFIRNIEGFGFVSPLEEREDIYIDKHDVMWNGIMHGDMVKVLKFYEPSKRKYYGKFVEFVSRRESHAIGRVIQTGGVFSVELRKTLEIVMIQRGRLSRARKDDWVEVEIKKWPEGRAPAYGEIVKIVDADTYIVLKEFHLTEEFPRTVIEESERIKEPPQG
ncbi:MAG: hypothetical protein NTY22_07870 [Proteobacteria bacterium]|nr:hypothetical protein [Pseudomonadota bacterium]